jgi:transcription elongation factor
MTYAYESGAGSITHLHWNDAAQQLTHTGAQAWTTPDSTVVEVVAQ